MQPTLVEVSAGHGCGGIGDGQPHSGVSPLLWGPQALPHGAVELWHGVGHRWSERVGSGLYIHVVVGWLGVCVWGRVCLWESVCVGDCVCRCFCVGGRATIVKHFPTKHFPRNENHRTVSLFGRLTGAFRSDHYELCS